MSILALAGLVSQALEGSLTGGALAKDKIAELLVQIAQKAANAYQLHTGQPIDPTVLKQIDPV